MSKEMKQKNNGSILVYQKKKKKNPQNFPFLVLKKENLALIYTV